MPYIRTRFKIQLSFMTLHAKQAASVVTQHKVCLCIMQAVARQACYLLAIAHIYNPLSKWMGDSMLRLVASRARQNFIRLQVILLAGMERNMAFKALPVSYGSALQIPLHILYPLIHKGHLFVGSFVAGKAYFRFSGN